MLTRRPLKRNTTICELTFPTTVLNVRLNRKRLVVILEDQIYLYDISNMKLVHTIDTSPNPHGIAALASSTSPSYLAYPRPQPTTPSSAQPSHVPPTSPTQPTTTPPGHVLIFDTQTLQPVTVIEAHLSPLSYIVFDSSGTRLATASDKGTIIRVFSVPDNRKLAQFRRGSMPTRIFSMAFNATGTLLAVSSASETVHIFKISDSGYNDEARAGNDDASSNPPSPGAPKHKRTSSNSSLGATSDIDDDMDEMAEARTAADITNRPASGLTGYLRRTSQTVGKSVAGLAAGYLPSSVNQMLEPARDFAWFKVPRAQSGPGVASGEVSRGGASGTLKSIVAMSRNSPDVMVVTNEGQYLVFGIDLEKGGEGVLKDQRWVTGADG